MRYPTFWGWRGGSCGSPEHGLNAVLNAVLSAAESKGMKAISPAVLKAASFESTECMEPWAESKGESRRAQRMTSMSAALGT